MALRKIQPLTNEELNEGDKKYLAALIQKQKDVNAALNSFVEFIHLEYKLTPGKDQVTIEGKIIREVKTDKTE